jgi:hypothetical protein
MAQRHLAQDLRTKKTNSLPDDLKAIAEELIGDKFGYEEEVVEKKSPNSFRGYDEIGFYDESIIGLDMGYGGDSVFVTRQSTPFGQSSNASFTRHEPGVERRIDFYSRRCVFSSPITSATTRAFRDAAQRLDMANARRQNRKAVVPERFAKELYMDGDFQIFAARSVERGRGQNIGRYLATLFGVDIFVVGEGVIPEITVSQ